MRKFLLFSGLIGINVAIAQRPLSTIHLIPIDPKVELRTLPKPVPTDLPAKPVVAVPSSTSVATLRGAETILGTTTYDSQTNRAISNRFIRHSDGTMSAVWTTLCPGGDASIDRGTGYNYFDGTSWLPASCEKIEPDNRTGFTNIAVTASGKEMAIAHSSTNGGMLITSRPAKGTGTWTEDGTVLGNFADDTWAKTISGGADGKTVHAIWNASGISTNQYCGQLGPVVYSRSTDDGVTWPVLRDCIDEIGPTFYLGFGADNYSIDALGNNVAILVNDWGTDQVLLTSTDNGDNWTKEILYEFPIPFYDEVNNVIDLNQDDTADVLLVPTGDGRISYDNNGMLHMVTSKTYVVDDDIAAAISYYPDLDGGIWYWNQNMDTAVLVAAAEDLDQDGVLSYPIGSSGDYFGSGTYGAGLSLQPTIGFDANNNVYITYSTYNELADTTFYLSGHRHVYVIASFDGGLSWTVPFNVVPSIAQGGDGEHQEAVYPCMAKSVDDKVRLIYQRDPAPGTSLSTLPIEADWNANTNEIIYAEVAQFELTSSGNIEAPSFYVSQNMPNPVFDETKINISLSKQAEVHVEIFDLLGRMISSSPSYKWASGVHSLTLDCSMLAAGTYFCEVTAGGEKVTRKMIVE